MLISSWVISGVLLLVQSALCSDEQDGISASGKTSKQLAAKPDVETYKYNHPPLAEITETKDRKEKSIDFNKESTPSPNRSRSRGNRHGTARTTRTQREQNIPVKIIYDAESTATSLNTRQSTTTSSRQNMERTKKVIVRRRLPQTSNVNKKIDVRQTVDDVNDKVVNTTGKVELSTEAVIGDISSSSEFPTRSRGSYFKKRTEPPPPRVKILNEENFVYSHSGNFHYSYLGGDGTKISSRGELRTYDNDKTGEAVSGNVFYKDKDGNDFSLSYTADENGYRPVGAHLPTPPPLPPAIARALKYIADKSTTTAAPDKNKN